MAEEQQDVETLKRRGRRRLVGAVALVLAAVIILPMVFDPEPRGTGSTVPVKIPAEDETPFAPKLPAKKPEPEKPEPAVEKKPEPAAKVTPLQKDEFFVPVGAFSSPQGVVAKLKAAKMPYYTEAAPNNLTRVRAGPFATREAAEKAVQRLKSLGLQPGAVASKSG
ncbi:MAG TPA: SPOR domain-containing protein [Burkholderiales bacterium]